MGSALWVLEKHTLGLSDGLSRQSDSIEINSMREVCTAVLFLKVELLIFTAAARREHSGGNIWAYVAQKYRF